MSDYRPSPSSWVRAQVSRIEEAGDTGVVDIMGRPVIMLTMTGARSGATLKVPLMRVEHDGTYLAVASRGGAPENPQWYYNLLANPDIELMDGTASHPVHARLAEGEERAVWWERAVASFPQYAVYQENTERRLPVFILEPRPHGATTTGR